MGFKNKGLFAVCLVLVTFTFLAAASAAPSLSLSFYKDNGYGMGNDITGLWTINAQISSDDVFVEFYLDGQLQENDTVSPFKWQFDTSNYTEDLHTIRVVAYNSAGATAVAESQRNFVGFPMTFVVGIIVVVVVAMLVPLSWAVYKVRKKEAKRNTD